jgi:hypothetical protein
MTYEADLDRNLIDLHAQHDQEPAVRATNDGMMVGLPWGFSYKFWNKSTISM